MIRLAGLVRENMRTPTHAEVSEFRKDGRKWQAWLEAYVKMHGDKKTASLSAAQNEVFARHEGDSTMEMFWMKVWSTLDQ